MKHTGYNRKIYTNNLLVYKAVEEPKPFHRYKWRRRRTRRLVWMLLIALALGCLFWLRYIMVVRAKPGEVGEWIQQAGFSGNLADNENQAQLAVHDNIKAKLEVQPVYQNPELVNGCEATSLAAVLNFMGYRAGKTELAYEYIPREDFTEWEGGRSGPSPEVAYAGDPATRDGFYCFAGPIVQGGNRYLGQYQENRRFYDISNAGMNTIDQYLQDGSPVILWVTLEFSNEPAYLNYDWRLPDGSFYTPYKNLHCVVVTGYGDKYYYVCDPLQGSIAVERQQLFGSYTALGMHAVTVA